jgi:hypothetical protein
VDPRTGLEMTYSIRSQPAIIILIELSQFKQYQAVNQCFILTSQNIPLAICIVVTSETEILHSTAPVIYAYPSDRHEPNSSINIITSKFHIFFQVEVFTPFLGEIKLSGGNKFQGRKHS